jgi:SAM-dependent methyltransferase
MQNLMSQASYWNRVAGEKRFSHPVQLSWLKHYLGPQDEPATILDYGCGYGRTLAELSRAGYQRIVGVDFSRAMLARCHQELPDAMVIQNDGKSLPLQERSIDTALLFAVLTCIPDSNEQRRQVAEVLRVLRPGGLLYISDLLINDDQRNRERYEHFAEIYKCYGVFELPEGVVVRHHRREWIDDLTSTFTRLEYEPFSVKTMNGNLSSAFQYLGRKPQQ